MEILGLTIGMAEMLTVTVPTALLVLTEGGNKDKKRFSSLYSSFGIIGTFWGITQGLGGFDLMDIKQSLPEILGHFTTSFTTSLIGLSSRTLADQMIDYLYPLQEPNTEQGKIASILEKMVARETQNHKELVETLRMSHRETLAKHTDTFNLLIAHGGLFKQMLEKQNKGMQIQNQIANSVSELSLKTTDTNFYASSIMEILSEIKNNYSKEWQNVLLEIMERFDQKIETRLQGIIENLVSSTNSMHEIVKENNEFQQKIIKDRQAQLDASTELASNCVVASDGFKSLVASYHEMQQNVATTSVALEQMADLGLRAKTSANSMDEMMKVFNDKFIQQYDETIQKATEEQANYLINVVATILNKIDKKVA